MWKRLTRRQVEPPRQSVEAVLLRQDDAFVRAVYRLVLGRGADPEGLNAHVAVLKAGHDRRRLMESVASSPEAKARHYPPFNIAADTSAEELVLSDDRFFVRAVYDTLLGREPDPPGMEHFLLKLKSGISRDAVYEDVGGSPEARNRDGAVQAVSVNEAVAAEPTPAPPSDGVERRALASDADFVAAIYRGWLRRPADGEGASAWLAALQAGTTRAEILREAVAIADAAGINGITPDDLTAGEPEQLLLRHDADYVRALFHTFLHREPNDESLRSHMQLIVDHDRPYVLDAIGNSHEAVVLRERLAGATGAVDDPFTLSRREWAMFKGFAPAAQSGAAFMLIKCTDDVTPVSPFVHRLAATWERIVGPLRLVLWNSESKALEWASLPDLEQLGLAAHVDPAIYRRVPPGLPRQVVEPTSCGADNWLIVAEPFRSDPTDQRLQELDAILKARALGLRSAFVFHGADALRTRSASPAAIAACEQYMQAMLLGDVILPVTRLAADDALSFFTDHQKASLGPLIRKVVPPPEIGGGEASMEEGWADYARSLHRVLRAFIAKTTHLRSIYYLDDSRLDEGGHQLLVKERLAATLAAQGVALIPVTLEWRDKAKSAVDVTSPELMAGLRPETIDGADQAARSAEWLLVPTALDGAALDAVAAFGRRHALRIAALLHDESVGPGGGGYPSGIAPDLPAYAQLDKVFIASKAVETRLYAYLLSTRDKVTSAEHRFRRLEIPVGTPFDLLRTDRTPVAQHQRHGVIWLAQGTDRAFVHAVGDATADVAGTSWTVIAALGDAEQRDTVQALRDAPGADTRLVDAEDFVEVASCLDAADIIIADGRPNVVPPPAIMDHVGQGRPCLFHQPPNARSFASFGELYVTSESNRGRLAAAVVRFVDRAYADGSCRAGAPIAAKWADFSAAMMADVRQDRPLDTQTRLDDGPLDAYRRMSNLKRRPKLSLCISTYNRAGWLALSLRNIFGQLGEPTAEVEVVVVDNTSTDNTPDVARTHVGRSDFTYWRNPVNVGMLGNLAVTAQRARGEYIWILGDDDLTRPGVIMRVLDLLKEADPPRLIYVNYGYTSEQVPANVVDLDAFLDKFNYLEPPSENGWSTVRDLAARTENFYTAIYSHVYRRDDALRSYCQDTSGPVFSTMESCIPTTKYVLSHLADEPAYWLGEPSLVVNSNVSWIDYAPIFELEHFPRAWDLAERMGTNADEVDQRRAARLWMTALMWRKLLENDSVGNSTYVSLARVLVRLKHLPQLDEFIEGMRNDYERARSRFHPAAALPTEELFAAFKMSEVAAENSL